MQNIKYIDLDIITCNNNPIKVITLVMINKILFIVKCNVFKKYIKKLFLYSALSL